MKMALQTPFIQTVESNQSTLLAHMILKVNLPKARNSVEMELRVHLADLAPSSASSSEAN